MRLLILHLTAPLVSFGGVGERHFSTASMLAGLLVNLTD